MTRDERIAAWEKEPDMTHDLAVGIVAQEDCEEAIRAIEKVIHTESDSGKLVRLAEVLADMAASIHQHTSSNS